MMGWVSRAASLALVGAVVGCAAIAGLDDPGSDTPDGSAIQSGDGGQNVTMPPAADGSPEEPGPPLADASDGSDAAEDAGDSAPPPPVCEPPLKPNGSACVANAECCKDACNEKGFCADSCRGETSSCQLTADAPCCYNLYCFGAPGGAATCRTCVPSGGTPYTYPVVGGTIVKSCCSKKVTGNVCD